MEIGSHLDQFFKQLGEKGQVFLPGYPPHIKEIDIIFTDLIPALKKAVAFGRIEAIDINTPWIKSDLVFRNPFFNKLITGGP